MLFWWNINELSVFILHKHNNKTLNVFVDTVKHFIVLYKLSILNNIIHVFGIIDDSISLFK